MGLIITTLAVLPFVLLLYLIVVLKWSALKAGGLTYVLTLVLGIFVWKIDTVLIGASFVRGALLGGEIMLIIFGAVWILELLHEKKQLSKIKNFIGGISKDARIQVILIAWLFGSLIEGIAGFGTPVALAAPLLVSLGFAPILAVVVSLIGNSTAVSFGAAGTPILLGLGGLGFDMGTLGEITRQVSILHVIGGLLIPVILVYFVSRKKRDFIEAIPFAIFSWLVFIIPYFLIAWFIGPELPSILAGFFSLIVVGFFAKKGFLVPKRVVSFAGRNVRSDEKEVGNWRSKGRSRYFGKGLFAILPYILIVIFLFLSRAVGFLRERLVGIELSWRGIFGTDVTYSLLPLYTPSFYFFLVGIISIFIYRANFGEVKRSLGSVFGKIKGPLIALILILGFVQLLIVSGENSSGLESIPILLATFVSGLFGKLYVFIAPFIGMIGSFIGGSNTVSNLLFGSFQAESAAVLGISVVLVLALQVVGGAVGNMIAIHNVLAASAVVGLSGKEGEIIRKTIWAALFYALVVGIVGLLIFRFY